MQNTKINRRAVLALIGGALAPIEARPALYPSRPIKIIVPFGPGGSGDITARLIGKQIEERTKQSVVIDNRPGANGIIGTMAVKTAEPDGYRAADHHQHPCGQCQPGSQPRLRSSQGLYGG